MVPTDQQGEAANAAPSHSYAGLGWSPSGSFRSTATDPFAVQGDYMDYMVGNLRSKGVIPPSTGITKPAPRITNAADMFDQIEGMIGETRKRRRGATFDNMETPVNETYRQRRFDFLKRHEAARPLAYDDETGEPVTSVAPVGNVTVGIGFNMARPDAPSVFQEALGLGRGEFDAVKTGRRQLSSVEIRRLFDHTIQEAEDIVSSRIGDDLTEHERLALVSMAFNGPTLIGPKITAAMQSGDRRAALNEILYNSNAKGINGLYNRRYAEASLFAGASNAESVLPTFSAYKSSVG